MKFGGSSLADADRIASVASIIASAARSGAVAAVVSAMGGVTNALLDLAERAREARSVADDLEKLRRRHRSTAEAVARAGERQNAGDQIDALFDELAELLHGVSLVRECSPRTRDLVASFGERLSAPIVAAAVPGATMIDARTIIQTDDNFGGAQVAFTESYARIRAALSQIGATPIVTGFIAATAEGVTTTIGRNGSDYTASLLGAALEAEAIEIWTDVDGVMNADPRVVREAFVVPSMSYHEAMELSYFGAKVLHPSTMVPAFERNIPILIKNTLNPTAPGTRIDDRARDTSHAITGIASIEAVAMVNVEGGGMVGMPGIAGRIFTALAEEAVNIIMISQASSEHSICFVVAAADANRAVLRLRRDLAPAIEQKRIERVEAETGLEIVAIIGENMRGTPGISGRLFSALGRQKINILAIAQGSSEMNISFVIRSADRVATLSAVHRAFFTEEAS